ncbi:MAG: hypothetical protein WCA95_03805 [Opitutaceae bacterium]
MEYIYARSKLGEAVEALAIGEGDVRSRIVAAMLAASALTEFDFPEELRADWEWIIRETTKAGPAIGAYGIVYQDAVQRTMFRMRRTTGVKIAKRIVALYHKVGRVVDA